MSNNEESWDINTYQDLIDLARNDNISFDSLMKQLWYTLAFHRYTNVSSQSMTITKEPKKCIEVCDENNNVVFEYDIKFTKKEKVEK